MDTPKIAIISYFYSESTLVLSKYLGNNAIVDYYYFASLKEEGSAGIEFNSVPKLPGVFEIKEKLLRDFLGTKKVTPYIIRIFNHSQKRKYYWLNSLIVRLIIIGLNRKKYDYINIVGHQDILIQFHKYLRCKNKVHTLHEVVDHLRNSVIDKAIHNYLYATNTKIIVHSESTLNELNRIRARSDINFRVNFGIFESYRMFRSRSRLEPTQNYILFYGLFRPYKGLDTLLRAIKILGERRFNHPFLIAGFGTDAALTELSKIGNVKIINKYLENWEICELNENAKVVVCPYKSASQSGIVMTSFLFHKPVIATKVGAFAEVLTHNENGLLVNQESPEDLANAIELIYSDSELYNHMVSNISQFSKNELYNWDKIAEATVEILQNHKY